MQFGDRGDGPDEAFASSKTGFGNLNMGNEMGNNNTSGLKDEVNTTTVEASKTSLVDTTNANNTKEEHQVVPEVKGNDFDKKVTNLTSNDPDTDEVPCIENQISCITEQEDTEVHRAESPIYAMESTEAREIGSKMNSDTSLSDSGQEKLRETIMEENDVQGTLQNQLKKQDSIRKEDEEDGTTSTSHKLEPEENNRIEACDMHLPDSTPEDDKTGEYQLVAEVEGSEIHEDFANLTSDHQSTLEDACVENQTSSILNDSEVHPLGESPKVWEEDIKVQPGTLLSDSVHEEIIEHKEETDIQGPMQYQLQKQDFFKKEDEEYGTSSTSHDIEAKDSKHFESNLHEELATVQADQSVKDGIGSLLGSKDCLGSNLTSDCESRGHFQSTETLKNIEGSSDSITGSALEKQGATMSLEHNTSEERPTPLEEKFETEDGEEVKNGLRKTLIASDGLLVLENECKIPTERNLFLSPKLEPEALLVSNFDLEVPEHEVKCLIIEDDIGKTGKGLENGEEIYASNQIQPCLVSGMESEPDGVKSSELTDEESEKVNVISPSSNKDCQVEEAKVVEDGNLVVMCLNNQCEASESQCYQESKMKVEEVPKLEIILTELTILNLHHKEEELVAIEMEEADTTQQDSSSSFESTTLEHDIVQNTNDSSPQLKQENSDKLFATQASIIIDSTSWISEALVSMNKLEAEILGQQVTQQKEAAQVETAAEINISAEVEMSSASVSSSSETQDFLGRSSTVSIESNPDNLNIVHGQIQKSPSFNLDLQNVERTEESDSTPLLYQDKAEIKSSPSQVEKVITLERSESEESKTPFLGFMKEQEETHIVVAENSKHQKHSAENSTKNVADSVTRKAATTSSKGKEKRRLRPSFFSNCLCCASVNN